MYQSRDRQWTCIQQRSPTIKGKRKSYVDALVQFASHFDRVVLLTSMDASSRLDSQINSVPFRVLGQDVARSIELGVPQLEQTEERLYLPGSGLTRHVYEKLQDKATLFIMFALEGGKKERKRERERVMNMLMILILIDNVQDSIEFGNYINSVLEIQKDLKQWTPPKSWEFLFGTPFNADLYH